MNTDLDTKLCEKYPKIFADRRGDMTRTAMCWGFECEDGWYTLIERLCYQLQWDIDHNGEEQIVASQVKEKYGGLRFYVNSSSDEQDAQIRFAETLSYSICEVCGNPGRANGSVWTTTRCDKHTKE